MYVWIWRHLPGGVAAKLAGSAVLLVAALAVLFLVVFPWAEPRLPFNDVTVEGEVLTEEPSAEPTGSPPATPSSPPAP